MADWREVDTIVDAGGRSLVVGIKDGKVTLRTLGTRTAGAVELDDDLCEVFQQVFISACWQAARESAGTAVRT
jgi:hypothetical protein